MEILVVFKTHLDLGYTDLAANIEKKYIENYIPHALDLAEKMKGSADEFIWTTGSWLIQRFLDSSDENRARMEKAIDDGLISWHALPFTMHIEMMDKPLYEYGLTLSKKLDERFGKKTIAAKCTDVPGFTKAAVPLLAKAGVKLVHIGVNSVSAIPCVPNVFRWKVGDESIIVIYDKDYGRITPLPGTDKLLCFAMTGDNCGPQSPEEIHAFYERIRADYPGAYIHASTLDEAAKALEEAAPELPVFEGEIGDSWNHGYQADPKKMTTYRIMLKYAETLPESEKEKVYSELLKVAEHTCGLGGKSYVNDDGNYCRADFELARRSGKYDYSEKSWEEQREYVTAAVNSLDEKYRKEAEKLVSEWKRTMPPITSDRLEIGKPFALGRFNLTVGNDGSVRCVKLDGKNCTEPWRRLFRFEYELFSHSDTMRFGEQYFRSIVGWGYDDFTKLGLDESPNSHILAGAHADLLYRLGDSVVCRMSAEPVLHEKYGCPARFTLTLTPHDAEIYADFAWYGKPASRIPEGMWLSFDGGEGEMAVRKLGMWIDPRETVKNGGTSLHGTDFGAKNGGMLVETKDCSLLSFGGGLWNYTNRTPVEGDELRFCLYDNQWNTNFMLWFGEDARFRFTVKFAE